MPKVQFDEDYGKSKFGAAGSYQKTDDRVLNFIINTGIAKDKSDATKVVFAMVAVFLIAAAILIYMYL